MGKERTPEEIAARKAKKQGNKVAISLKKKTAKQVSKAGPQFLKRVKQDESAGPAPLKSRLNPMRDCFDPELKARWGNMPRHEKQVLIEADEAAQAQAKKDVDVPQLPSEMPFPVNSDDHCETAPAAYHDIAPLLELVAKRLGIAKEALRIYDPYYCSGAVKRHLLGLGFASVHNQCEDFYSVIAEDRVPEHDVVVTNPPYSEDPDGGLNHVARLLDFLRKNKRPYILNMPEYIASAEYYQKHFQKATRLPPLLFCPRKRYHFWSPENARADQNSKAHRKFALGVRSSPFVTLWYISLRPVVENEELLELASSQQLPFARAPTKASAGARSDAYGCLCQDLATLPEARHLFQALEL